MYHLIPTVVLQIIFFTSGEDSSYQQENYQRYHYCPSRGKTSKPFNSGSLIVTHQARSENQDSRRGPRKLLVCEQSVLFFLTGSK